MTLAKGPLRFCILVSAIGIAVGCALKEEANQESATPSETKWTAQWIVEAEAAKQPRPNSWYCFRNSCNVKTQPKRAVARIAVDSKYWLWVNEELVVFEGELKRGPTPDDTYYDEVDLTQSVHEGKNTICVLVWYWGKDSFSHKSSGSPGLIFLADIDGQSIVSDDKWRVIRHPAYGETGDPQPNFRLAESNIHFDSRLDLGDWRHEEFDDSRWGSPKEMGSPPISPWNRLMKRPIPL